MTYLFPLMFMLPASYFYHLCWIFRIPFLYLAGVNMVRLYYGSWLIKNAMEDVDYVLVLMTALLYLYAFVKFTCISIGTRCKDAKRR